MRLAVSCLTALRALRAHRSGHRGLPQTRVDLPAPDPSPQQRWTARIIPLDQLALDAPPSDEHPVDVVVPDSKRRLRGRFFSCSVRSGKRARASFVPLGDGLFIPSPEALFLELANVMSPETHALLGYELCGTYSRDPRDPRCGAVTHGIPPVTSVADIEGLLSEAPRGPGVLLARRTLRRVAGNAWSAMEAIVALMACLPVHELGYELGRVRLNARHDAPPELVALGGRTSRVPDIEVLGTRVGFNYDSHQHLDLESIARAADGGNPAQAIALVREKHLDDLRRNRELAAMGHIVLPVTPNDLFAPGGLDAVMLEAALAIDAFDGGNALSNVWAALESADIRRRRQELVWSLLPWDAGVTYARKRARWVPWRPYPED